MYLSLTRALAAVAFGATLCTMHPVLAQERTVQLRLSDFNPPGSPADKAMVEWAASVEKDSGGTIKATVFPAQQLGKAFDQYDMVRDGIADLAYVVPGYQPGRFPIIVATELPLMFSNGKAGTAAVDAWYRPLAAREMKDVKFCYAFTLEPGTFHSRKKITVPADIKGMKVRPAQSTIGSLISSLGGTNVQGPAPDARDLLEKGVADAVTFPYGSLVQYGMDKLTSFHLDVALYTTTFVFVMNQDTYQGMSAAQRSVIDGHCTKAWADRVGGPWSDFERAGKAIVRAEPNQTFVSLTPEEMEEWRKASQFLYDQWQTAVKHAGGDPAAIMASLKAISAQENAAY